MLNKIKSWIPKEMLPLIQELDEDTEVWEVLLKEGYQNSAYGETVWVFGKWRYFEDDYTQSQIKEDLLYWLQGVEKL